MAYSVEVMKSAVERFLNDENIDQISKELRVSANTIYGWLTPDNVPSDAETQKKLSMKIKGLYKSKKYNEAKKICERFVDNPVIQSQLVSILIGESSFDKAERICRKFKDYAPLQSQLVRIFVKKGKIEEAKEICEKFKDHAPIQSQLVRILINQGDLDKAQKICDKFADDKVIKTELMPMLSELIKAEEANKRKTIGEVFAKEIEQIKTNLKRQLGDSNTEEIEKLELISQRGNSDLRAKMQFLIYLNRYGLADVAEKRFKVENEIYQEIYRIVLFSKDNPNFSKNKLVRSKAVKDIRHTIILNGGNEEYADELINKAMKSEVKEPSLG